MKMRILGLVLTILIVTVPMLWIENYTLTNPVFWTVYAVWFLGRFVGWFEIEKEN